MMEGQVKTGERCIELVLPVSTFEAYQYLNQDNFMVLNASASHTDENLVESLKVKLERKEPNMMSIFISVNSVQLFINEKSSNHWCCTLDDIKLGKIKKKPLKISRSNTKWTRSEKKKHWSKRKSHSRSKVHEKLQWSDEQIIDRSGSNEMGNIKVESSEEKILSVEDVGLVIGNLEACDKVTNGIGIMEKLDDDCDDAEYHEYSVIESDVEPPTDVQVRNDTDVQVSNDAVKTETQDLPSKSEQPDDNETIISGTENDQPKLKFICKFCFKLFDKGKKPLVNLQKHVITCCPVLHPKASEKDLKDPGGNARHEGTFCCPFCKKWLMTRYNRDRHMITCEDNPQNGADMSESMVQLIYCDKCNWPSRNEHDLHKHCVQSHGAPRKQRKIVTDLKDGYGCRYCGTKFRSTSSRSIHQLYKCSKNMNVTKSLYCPICTTRCKTKEALEDHIVIKHKDKNCPCKICGKDFRNKNAKSHHMVTTHRENPRRFACPHCTKTYMYKKQLDLHITRHSDEKNVQCSICGKCFKNQRQERKHRLYLHEGRYPYKCNHCGHGMEKRKYLKTHLSMWTS